MPDEELLTVGRFATLSGLTPHTLRHYDAVDLLRPAEVDPSTGYRRYHRDQLVAARVIRDLRWLDLPVDQVRIVTADPASPAARSALDAHAGRLRRQRAHLTRQLQQCTDYVTEGVPMPQPTTAVAPVQVKLGVQDVARSKEFYDEAFGLREQVIRHTDEADFGGYQFGTYGQPGFFLLVLVGPDAFDHPERSTVGLTVADLDVAHHRAVAAGGTEAVAPNTQQGMPRNSAVTDPDGNWVWLYQG